MLDHLTEFTALDSPLAGDLDGDCTVNVNDLTQLTTRWRLATDNPYPDSNTATPNYETWADIIHDEVINILDIMEVVGHWGTSCAEAP